ENLAALAGQSQGRRAGDFPRFDGLALAQRNDQSDVHRKSNQDSNPPFAPRPGNIIARSRFRLRRLHGSAGGLMMRGIVAAMASGMPTSRASNPRRTRFSYGTDLSA